MTEEGEKYGVVADNQIEKNERCNMECLHMKEAIESTRKHISAVNKEQKDFDEKFEFLTNDLKSNLVQSKACWYGLK